MKREGRGDKKEVGERVDIRRGGRGGRGRGRERRSGREENLEGQKEIKGVKERRKIEGRRKKRMAENGGKKVEER